MPVPSVIKDRHSGHAAKVSRFGQLVVAPLAYSTPSSDSLDVINIAFNFITPEQGQSIVITDIIASADNSVSAAAPADVVIYTADAVDSTTVIEVLVEPQIFRGTNFTLTGLNLLVEEGLWVNAKTNDDAVPVTIMFYRVPAEDV